MIIQNVVGVGVTFAATVCISQGFYHRCVNVTQNVWQITRNIVPPELATLKLTDCSCKLLEVYTSLTFSNLFPMYILGARLSVATFIVERAGCRAGLTAAGAGGNGASLGVGADGGESEVHGLGVNCSNCSTLASPMQQAGVTNRNNYISSSQSWSWCTLTQKKFLPFSERKNTLSPLCCSIIQCSQDSIRLANLFLAFLLIGWTEIIGSIVRVCDGLCSTV